MRTPFDGRIHIAGPASCTWARHRAHTAPARGRQLTRRDGVLPKTCGAAFRINRRNPSFRESPPVSRLLRLIVFRDGPHPDMSLSMAAVAVCCSRASISSRLSSAIFLLLLAEADLVALRRGGRTAFFPFRPRGVFCFFATSPPTLIGRGPQLHDRAHEPCLSLPLI
jgi:hypothetical protein